MTNIAQKLIKRVPSMKHFLLPLLLAASAGKPALAQQTLSYPTETFTCSAPAASVTVDITYMAGSRKLALKVRQDTASTIAAGKEAAEKFLTDKIRELLLKNCPAIGPAEYDVRVPLRQERRQLLS